MDASLQSRAEQLATEFASQASTAEELNGLMRLMMKSALERMLNTELDVHLGRRASPQAAAALAPDERASNEPLPCDEPDQADNANLRKRSPNRRNGKSPRGSKAIWANLRSPRPAIATTPLSRCCFPSTSGACRGSTKRSWPCMPRE